MLSRLLQTWNRRIWLAVVFFCFNALILYKYSNNKRELPSEIVEELSAFRRQGRQPSSHDVESYNNEPEDSGTEASNIRRTPSLILYNRVPKTGSTTFANIAYSLTAENGFNMLHVNTTRRNDHYLNVVDQHRFVSNISEWKAKQPALYHGHMYYLDFTRFGYQNPIYINIVREPMERLISYYYFLRNGDDYRPHVKRARASNSETFDECVINGGRDCNPSRNIWIQVPFFCGQSPRCQQPSEWALEQAKTNLLNKYLLVGITEQLGDFIALLEAMLPDYFSGAYDLYTSGKLSHLRRTKGKITPNETSLGRIRESKAWKLEQEFYLFAKEQFNFLKGSALTEREDGKLLISNPRFRYEKIFPETGKKRAPFKSEYM